MASRAMKMNPKKAIASDPRTVTDDAVAARAYELWLDRGCPIGSPELDWFQAEQELKKGKEASASAA